MTQRGYTNQMISNSDCIYMPSCLSYNIFLIVRLLLIWLWYSLKTLLQILKKLRGFIIRLDMQYFNAARKLNWTGTHLCILRPIPAHSEWITGGLSQFCRDPILNIDRKWFSGAKKAFIFHFFFPLSFMVLNSIKFWEGYLPSQGWWKWEFGFISFCKERAVGMKSLPLSILATCNTKKQSKFSSMKFFSKNTECQTPNGLSP